MAMKKMGSALPISVAYETPSPSSINVDHQPQDTDEMPFEFEHLPKELAMEIMLWLPVESLMQFKLVNKSIYSLISGLVKDPNFVAKHIDYHSIANNSASLVSCHLVRSQRNNAVFEPSVWLLTLLSNQGEICHTGEELHLPPFTDDGKSPILDMAMKVNHCNGIVCIVDQCHTVCFCNPALREFKRVRPKSCIDPMNGLNYLIEEAGLGYDSRSDKYKVVRIFRMLFPYELRAEVYTLGTDSWREIDIFVPNAERLKPYIDCPVYYKGCCYWLMRSSAEEISMLLCFDMSTEVFQIVTLPNYYDCNWILWPRWRLAMWNGSVCLLCYDGEVVESSLIRKWVMEIERLDGASSCNYSWRECKSIGFVPKMLATTVGWVPYTFWKEDELLMSNEDDEIGSYNVKTKKLRMLTTLDLFWSLKLCSKPYVASLVSVKTVAKVIAESST